MRRFAHCLHDAATALQRLRESEVDQALHAGPAIAKTLDMNAESTRRLLLAQHDRLRERMETCVRIAKLYEHGEVWGADLDSALETLREELAVHNATETRVIGQLLHGPAAWGSLLIDRMLDEHIAEHAAFWELLSGTHAEIAARIEDLADELEAHMAAEERTFLAPITLRDDVIRVRTREDEW